MSKREGSEYLIRVTRSWYGPKRTVDYLRDADGRVVVCESRAAAISRIEAAERLALEPHGAYELAHNEASSPMLRPVPIASAPAWIMTEVR